MYLALLLNMPAVACTNLFGPSDDIVVMDIASQQVACVGAFPQQCFRVRQQPDTTWTTFYDSIDGFEFVAGFEYTVGVRVREVSNPPADASNRAYKLLKVLRKTPSD